MTAPTETPTTGSSDGAPTPRVLLAVVALAAVAGAVLVGLYALSPAPRVPLVTLASALAPYCGGLGPLLLAFVYGRNIKRETAAQSAVLAKIDHQTNGVLEARMERAAAKALMRAGLLEQARADAAAEHAARVVPEQRAPVGAHAAPESA